MFRQLILKPDVRKAEVLGAVKKDRTQSKAVRMKEKAKALKKLKVIKENGDISEEDNKMVEYLLKGINVVLLNSKADLRMAGDTGNELKACLESEM